MTESVELQPWQSAPVSIERRKPAVYTPALRFTANGALTASGLLVIPPILLLWFLGATPALMAAGSALVAIVWCMSILENRSLWANQRLRDQSYQRLREQRAGLAASCVGFVGVCRRGYLCTQIWHSDMAHEDVGTLCAPTNSLEFEGDNLRISIPRSAIKAISFRTNPVYAPFGIRWIRIDYQDDGQQRYLYVQSRERDRLSQLPSCNKALLDRLNAWLSGGRRSHASPDTSTL
ncbi:MAG TPA: hypothetical protein VFJ58_00210 [Armatimonadota bacterium]|nr:hypothetical protein [Armatimonadota bacterium]